MIYNYPYYGFPSYMNYMNNNLNFERKIVKPQNSYNPYISNPRHNNTINYKSNYKDNNNDNNFLKKTYKIDGSSKKCNSQDSPIFELFGIKLYFDDILLICLIFFLYNEKVDDTYLLLALILLLLS